MDNLHMVVSLLVLAGILKPQLNSLPLPFLKKKDSKESRSDIISQLPEAIMSLIISRLEIREAVRTSTLSRNWRNVYLSMPALKVGRFDLYRNPQSFAKTVNDFLRIDMRFCPIGYYVLYFEQWMKAIATVGFEHLDMTFDNLRGVKELISETAGSLKHMNLCQRNLVLSRIVQFNSLKRLRLYAVLCGEELLIIFSSCLNLEKIEFDNCELPSKLSINASHKLKFVLLYHCSGTNYIHICAASLVSFMLVTLPKEKLFELSLSGVPKLKRLHVFDPYGTFPMPRVFRDFATELPLLEWLSYRVFTDKLEYINAARNAFGNLKELRLSFEVDLLPNLLNVAPILEACPVLEKLHLGVDRLKALEKDQNVRMQLADVTISEGAGLPLWKVKSRLDKDRVETSSLSIPIRHHMHLKEVMLGGFWGIDTDIELALFILKRAVVLERMVINGTFKSYVGRGDREIDNLWYKNRDAYIEEHVREMIKRKLHGQAISTTAKVIIEEEGCLITRKCFERVM